MTPTATVVVVLSADGWGLSESFLGKVWRCRGTIAGGHLSLDKGTSLC